MNSMDRFEYRKRLPLRKTVVRLWVGVFLISVIAVYMWVLAPNFSADVNYGYDNDFESDVTDFLHKTVEKVTGTTVRYESWTPTEFSDDFCYNSDKDIEDFAADEHLFTECRPIKSTRNAWNITLCRRPNRCNMVLVHINPMNTDNCLFDNNNTFYQKTDYTDFEQQLIGPDTFYFIGYGSEKLYASYQNYHGDCHYTYGIKIHTGGPTVLEAFHIYDNFNGISTLHDTYPPVIDNPIFANPLSIEFCPGCEIRSIKSDISLYENNENKTRCSVSEPHEGYWLPMINDESKNYTWIVEGCKQPFEMVLFSQFLKSCFLSSNYSLLIAGDSHITMLGLNIAYRLQLPQLLIDGQAMMTNTKHIDHLYGRDHFSLRTSWDPFAYGLLELTCEKASAHDAIVFEFGGWPAGSSLRDGHWSDSRYFGHLDLVIDHLKSLASHECRNNYAQGRPLTIIWHGLLVAPPRFDPKAEEFRDWRTLPRMRYWNEVAQMKMKEAGFRRINGWNITLGMTDTTDDGLHFLRSDAMRPISDEIFYKLGICQNVIKY